MLNGLAQLLRAAGLAWQQARRGALLSVLAATAAATAFAEQEGQAPSLQLVLSSPFSGSLWRADVDEAERYVVSASHAHVVTVWPTEDFTQRDLRRFPLRTEESRRSYPPAISPDAKLIAYGVPPLAGKNGFPKPGTGLIYIFEREADPAATKPIRTLNVPMRSIEIRFSPDNNYLAATFAGGCGLRVWSTKTWEPVVIRGGNSGGNCCDETVTDTSTCQARPITYALSFNPSPGSGPDSGPWLATSGDTGVDTYKFAADAIEHVAAIDAGRLDLTSPAGIAFNPDGKMLAVGDRRSAKVTVVDARSLEPQRMLYPQTHFLKPANETLSLNQVAWLQTPDSGLRIYAAGYLPCHYLLGDSKDSLEICVLSWPWAREATARPDVFPFGYDTIMTMRGLPRSSRLLVAGQRQIALLKPDGSAPDETGRQIFSNGAIDFRGVAKSGSVIDNRDFRVSDDAKSVFFEDYARRDTEGSPLAFRLDLTTMHLETNAPDATNLIQRDQNPEVVQQWRNVSLATPAGHPPETFPKVLGKDISGFTYDPFDYSRAVDVYRKNGQPQYVLWGTSNYLRLVEASSAKVVCELPITSEAFRVKLVRQGKIAVVGHGDGVLRWYRISRPGHNCSVEPLLSALVDQKTPGIWQVLAWKPDGVFAGPNFDSAGWLDSQSTGRTQFFGLSNFAKFYQPQTIAEAIEAPTIANFAADKSEIEDEIVRPSFEVTSPFGPINTDQTSQALEFNVKPHASTDPAERDQPFEKPLYVELHVNTHNVVKKVGNVTYGETEPIKILRPGSYKVEFEIPKAAIPTEAGKEIYFIFKVSVEGKEAREQRQIRRVWTGLPSPKPRRLLALVVGVSNYHIDGLSSPLADLQYAHLDAIDFATLLLKDYEDEHRPRDFPEMKLALFVAMPANADMHLLDRFRNKADVDLRTNDIKRNAIVGKISEYMDLDKDQSGHDDLILIYFSGHGMVKEPKSGNSTAREHFLLLPGFDANATAEQQEDRQVTEGSLIEKLENRPQEKLIALDACQSSFAPAVVGSNRIVPLDQTSLALHLKKRIDNAYLFLSTDSGVPSLEQDTLSFQDVYQKLTSHPLFNVAPNGQHGGNGLFTVALLQALVNPASDRSQPKDNRIDMSEMKLAIKDFYNPVNTPEINTISAITHRQIPQPICEPISLTNESSYLRTLP